MRIRRKKNLEERLEKVKKKLLIIDKKVVNVNEALKDKRLLDFESIFNNDNPVCVEIGCGKGGFILETAKISPDKNFLAVEMMENIILLAVETAMKTTANNLYFMNTGAEYLPRYIKDNSVSEVYLNFSPPYPQKNRENRRLTNDRFIKVYKDMLVNGGKIHLKTDDLGFYEYSQEKLRENGFDVENTSEKVKNGTLNNVLTEYEKKFISQGLPIYYLTATKRHFF